MTIPESWDTTMRDCIGSKTALIVHMGDSAPDLDEFTVQFALPSGIFFRVGDDDIYAHH